MVPFRLVIAAVLVCSAAFAQSGPARPEFEVASIKPSPPQRPNQAAVGVHVDGAQLRCNYLLLRDYVRISFRLRDDSQVIGPDWIATERFDIAAKIPPGLADKRPEMMQALLEDRFQMQAHREKRDLSVYALVAGKSGLKIQPLPPDPDEPPPGARAVDVDVTGGPGGVFIKYGRGSSFSLGSNKFEIKKLTLTEFADALSRFADRQVIDMTGVPGRFDITIPLTEQDYTAILIRTAIKQGVTLPPEAMRALEGVSGDSFFRSLETAGLKLDARKAPIDVVVVDKISKAPTEN
jgi:uncharacterized protein (TIGR03435 family)